MFADGRNLSDYRKMYDGMNLAEQENTVDIANQLKCWAAQTIYYRPYHRQGESNAEEHHILYQLVCLLENATAHLFGPSAMKRETFANMAASLREMSK